MRLEKSLGASQEREFKSRPDNRRSSSFLGVCNVWTSKEHWDGNLQSVVCRRLHVLGKVLGTRSAVGWGCLHIQRELRWTPGGWETERLGDAVCTPKENWGESQGFSRSWRTGFEERRDWSFQVPTLRLTSLCFFWQRDHGIDGGGLE